MIMLASTLFQIFFLFFFFFSGQEWMSLVPFVGTVSIIVYVTVLAFRPPTKPKDVAVNMKIQKESPKVVNMVDIEDLGDKISYCRCWRSKKVGISSVAQK